MKCEKRFRFLVYRSRILVRLIPTYVVPFQALMCEVNASGPGQDIQGPNFVCLINFLGKC